VSGEDRERARSLGLDLTPAHAVHLKIVESFGLLDKISRGARRSLDSCFYTHSRWSDRRATLVNVAHERQIMKLTFLGKDSTPNDSPTLYATDRDTFLVQGYVVTDPEALGQMHIPAGETVVEVPMRLMKYLPEDAHGEGVG
jgi:hypothetical protein